MRISDAFFTAAMERGACSPAEAKCLALLDSLGIPYRGLTHDPADTIELCHAIEARLGAPIPKNLFLCNRQETDFYLLVTPGDKIFKTKYLSQQIGASRLSFAGPAHMERLLGVTPGSASILALANDTERRVRLLIDEDVLKEEDLGFHPCLNGATVRLKTADITGRFLPAIGVSPQTVALPDGE